MVDTTAAANLARARRDARNDLQVLGTPGCHVAINVGVLTVDSMLAPLTEIDVKRNAVCSRA